MVLLGGELIYESNGALRSENRAKMKKLWPKQCSTGDSDSVKVAKGTPDHGTPLATVPSYCAMSGAW